MGLWVGVGEAWREWCEYEDWDPGTLGVRHVVELTPEANVLVLETPEELDQFTARFGIQTYPDHLLAGDFEIDWEQVKNVHQGLIIAPYQWTRRHALYWYYGWDCASGCIWDENAIYAIREVTA